MYDNLDGTYTYSYSSNLDGTITVSVLLYTNGGIYAEYFDSSTWSGTPATKTTLSTLNSGWTSGTLITASRSSYVTIAYYARIKAPTSDTYTIYIEVDDTAKVFIDSTLIISKGYGNYTATVTLNYDQYHELIIYYSQNTGDAEVKLSWSYTGQSKVIIPTRYLYYPTYVASSPIQVTVSCPTGYTGSNPSSTTKCIEIPGDGLRVGTEQCDDGNTVNGDGCNSTMYIECMH